MLVIVVLVTILLSAVGLVVWLWSLLQKDAEAAREKSVEPLADIKTMRPLQSFDDEKKALEGQIDGLKQEIAAARTRGQEQEGVAAQIITDLRAQCDALRRNVIDLESSSAAVPVEQDDARLDHLRAENAAFRSQLDEAAAETRQLKEQVQQAHQENERIKGDAGSAAAAQKLVDAARQEYQHQMESFYKEIEQLRTDNGRLQQQAAAGAEVPELRRAIDGLSAKVQELEAAGGRLSKKNEYLQYELTKSRAEVVGLERLCENVSVMARGPRSEAGVV